MSVADRGQFLSQLSVQFGPADLFARFFLSAVQIVEQRGISLELGSPEEFHETNQLNSGNWRTLMTSFQPEVGGARPENCVVLFGRNQDGDIILTNGIRLFDWSGSNLKIEAEALRMAYAEPERYALDGESYKVTAPNAAEITGRVGLGGGVWYHPDYRKTELTMITPRIARAVAFTHYGLDNIIALFAPGSVAKNFHTRIGFRDMSDGIVMHRTPSDPNEDIHVIIGRQQPNDIIDDTFSWLWSHRDVDSAVDVRRA